MNQKKESTDAAKSLNRAIKIDEARIHSHLDEMVRDTVQETLNTMLDGKQAGWQNAPTLVGDECRKKRSSS